MALGEVLVDHLGGPTPGFSIDERGVLLLLAVGVVVDAIDRQDDLANGRVIGCVVQSRPRSSAHVTETVQI